MKFVFIGHNYETGSQHMRGVAMAKALQSQGIDAKYTINEKIRNVVIDKDTVCVFIKVVWPETLKLARKNGARLVYDVIDSWVWSNVKHNWDYVIASNKEHKQYLSTLCDSKIVIIPHLHANKRYQKPISKLETIGYIGLDKQFSITAEMQKFCKKADLNWYQSGGGDPKTVEKETLNLDLGLIYATPEMGKLGLNYENTIKFKPATKLTNLFSYGIPTLFNPTTSFDEVVAQDNELQYLRINSIDEMCRKIIELKKHPEKLVNLSNRCYALSEKYDQSQAKEYYLRFTE